MPDLDVSVAEIFPLAGVRSLSDLMSKDADRCGVYELRFANGDRYVGQAVDVVTRVSTHRLNWPDLVEVAFWRIPLGDLDAVETAEILRQDALGVRLRNEKYTKGRLGASSFDIVVPKAEQDAWEVSAVSDVMDLDARAQHPALRREHHVGFNKMITDPRFAKVQFALRRYIAWTIPVPQRTEMSYWSISARPGTLGGERLCTLTRSKAKSISY